MKINVAVLFFLCFFYFFPLKAFANNILLDQDFNSFEGSLPSDWIKIDPDGSQISNNFTVQNGRAGNIVNTLGVEELIYPDPSWKNYILEFDMISFSGDDRNIVFRWKDKNHRLGFHITGGKLYYEKLIPNSEKGGPLNPHVPPIGITAGKMPHNMIHKITITVNDRNIKFHLKNALVDETLFDYTDNNQNMILNGSIGLRVGKGSGTTSSVWFDNVKVTQIHSGESLDVPHFSQLDPFWKDLEYDSASQTNPLGLREIGDWGCALTSAAMILNYHGYHTTPTGEATTPKTLNQYLNQNNGFTQNGNIIWNKIGSFTTHAATNSAYLNQNLPKLELNYQAYDREILESDLEATNPAILKIIVDNQNTTTWSDDNLHFVTTNGIDDQNIIINDPLNLLPQETILANSYQDKEIRHMVRFTKSYTDLSYLWVYVYDSNANILFETDNNKYGVDPSGNEYNLDQISYFEDGAIAAPTDFENRFGENSQARVFLLPKPNSGEYKITISNHQNFSSSSAEIHLFDQNGESKQETILISTTPTSPFQANINFDKSNVINSSIQLPEVTLDTVMLLIETHQSQNLIESSFAKRLKKLVTYAIQFSDQKFIKNIFLNRITYLTNKYPENKISTQSKLEINNLITSLKNM